MLQDISWQIHVVFIIVVVIIIIIIIIIVTSTIIIIIICKTFMFHVITYQPVYSSFKIATTSLFS